MDTQYSTDRFKDLVIEITKIRNQINRKTTGNNYVIASPHFCTIVRNINVMRQLLGEDSYSWYDP